MRCSTRASVCTDPPGRPLALRPDGADTPFMGGSTADTPTTPESLRASDAERDHAVGELRNEFVEGRLSHETFMYRMQTALDARHRGQLAGLFTDLPPRRAADRAAPPGNPPRRRGPAGPPLPGALAPRRSATRRRRSPPRRRWR